VAFASFVAKPFLASLGNCGSAIVNVGHCRSDSAPERDRPPTLSIDSHFDAPHRYARTVSIQRLKFSCQFGEDFVD
jgi:hypothetical protein